VNQSVECEPTGLFLAAVKFVDTSGVRIATDSRRGTDELALSSEEATFEASVRVLHGAVVASALAVKQSSDADALSKHGIPLDFVSTR